MATKRSTGSRSEVIRCPNCGEDYSVTYKRCPFCDEKNLPQDDYYEDYEDDEYIEGEPDEERPVRKKGKRVAGNQRRGGGYGGGSGVLRILGTVCSLALIVAAVWIVFNVISPMVGRSEIEPPPPVLPSAAPVVTPSAPLPEPEGTGAPEPDETLGLETVDVPSVSPSATPPPSAGNLKLSSGDFTLFQAGDAYTFRVTGASGAVTFKSDKPEVAAVTEAGKVSAVSKGIANITVTDASGATAKCIVRCNLPAAPAVSTSTSAAPGGPAKLNREDFTLSKAGQKFKLEVTGASGTPTWSISGDGQATIASDGTVTAVSEGTVTVTCTVDGQTLKCIVRCNW